MKLKSTISIQGVDFIATKSQVVVSPPDPSRPKRYYANINPVNRSEISPICFAIGGCWRNANFVDEIIARGASDHQSVAGFWFFNPDEFEEEPPPTIRLGLKPGERGVLSHFMMDDSVEASIPFFTNLAVAFGEFCIENGVDSRHTKSDLDRIRAEFNLGE